MKNNIISFNKKNIIKIIVYIIMIILLSISLILFLNKKQNNYKLTTENINIIIEKANDEEILPDIKDDSNINIISVSKDWKKEDAIYFTYPTKNDENAFVLIESQKDFKNGEFNLYVYESNSYISWQKEKTNIYKLYIDEENYSFNFIETIPISFENGALKISNSNVEMLNMAYATEEEYKYSVINRYKK